MLQPGPDTSSALTLWSTIVQAIAAVVVAGFGAVQIWREQKREARGRRGAAARISAHGYLLRRELSSWVSSDFEGWIRNSQNVHSLVSQLESASARAHAMMELLGDASDDTAEGVQVVFVLTLEAGRRIREFATMGHPSGAKLFEYVDLLKHAEADVRDCIKALDGVVVDRRLLVEETTLSQARQDDTFDRNMHRLLVAEGILEADEPLTSPALRPWQWQYWTLLTDRLKNSRRSQRP